MATPRSVSRKQLLANKKHPQRKSAKKAGAKVSKRAAQQTANKVAKKVAKKAAKKIAKRVIDRTAKQKAFVKKKPSTPAPAQEIGPEVLELIAALDAYKLKYNRPFPGWSEVLYVLKGLGYNKS